MKPEKGYPSNLELLIGKDACQDAFSFTVEGLRPDENTLGQE